MNKMKTKNDKIKIYFQHHWATAINNKEMDTFKAVACATESLKWKSFQNKGQSGFPK